MFNENDEKRSLLLIDRANRLYFSGVDVAEGYLFIGKKCVYFADSRYYYALKQGLKNSQIECRLYVDHNSILQYFCENKIKETFVDYDSITLSEYNRLKKGCKKISNGKDYIDLKRMVKTQAEIDNISKACEIAEKSFHESILELKIGMTEIEFKDILETKMISLGAEKVSFETIVAFGKNSAVPHHQTGDTKLKDDMPILVDMGCKYKGYCSDITRMAFKGKPSQRFIDCYQAVLEANELAENQIIIGQSGRIADKIARDFLAEKGLAEYFTHSLGHGIGLDIHESPRLSPKGEQILTDNMVFSIEPGVYFDGEFGIRIEDTVMMQNGRVKRLYKDEKNLIIL